MRLLDLSKADQDRAKRNARAENRYCRVRNAKEMKDWINSNPRLIAMFYWGSSPEGHSYWAKKNIQ